MTREKKRDSSEKRSSNNKYSSNLKLTGVMMFSILLLAMIVAPVSYLLYSNSNDLIFANSTESTNFGARLQAAVLSMDFNSLGENFPNLGYQNFSLYEQGTYIKDGSVYNNFGTSSGLTKQYWWNGNTNGSSKINGSLQFDGVNDAVTIPYGNGLNISSSNYTISIWLNAKNVTVFGVPIGSSPAGTNQRLYLGTSVTTSGKLGWAIQDSTPIESNSVILTDTWYNAILTTNGTTAIFYLNGVQQSATKTFTSYILAGNFRLGQITGSGYFNGTIDDVIIWGRALNASEISTIYNEGVAGRTVMSFTDLTLDNSTRIIPESSRVAYYNFNSNDNGTDSWGNNNLTCNNGPPCPVYNSTGGIYGSSAYLYSSDTRQAFKMSNSTLLNGSSGVTLAAWVKTPQYWSGGEGIIWMNDGTYFWGLRLVSPGYYSMSYGFYNINTPIPDYTKWHFLVGTMNQSGANKILRLYMDGQFIGTVTENTAAIRQAGNITIGEGFQFGYIDEVMIFNRSLTEFEISDMYNGQIAHYRLDELSGTIAGTSSIIANGTLTSYPTTALTAPSYNATGGVNGSGAYVFDGGTDYISVLDSTSLSSSSTTKQISLSAWIYPKSISNEQTIFSKYGATASCAYVLELYQSKLTFNAYGGTPAYVQSSVLPSANQWYFITTTFDQNNRNVTFYINGVLNSSATYNGVMGTNTNPLYLGEYSTFNQNYFNGTIDNPQIFNRVLSASEVMNLYNGTNANKTIKYSTKQGDFTSGVFYNTTQTYWKINLSTADATARSGIVNTDNSINISNPNLVSYWALDGNYLDAKGRNNGTCTSCPSNASGISSDAKFFDRASSQWVNTNANVGTTFTVSSWVNVRGLTSWNAVWTMDAGTGAYAKLGADPGNTYLSCFESAQRLNLGTVNYNTWEHYVCVYNSSGVFGYRNGAYVTNLAIAASDGANMVLGRYYSSTDTHYFNGSIDEVVLYNKSLTLSDISQLYKSGLSQHANTNVTIQTRTANNYNVSDPALVSLWAFNNDSSIGENATRFVDLSGRNNGTAGGISIPIVNSTSGIIGNGLDTYHVAGASCFVNVSHSSSLNITGNITISAWVNILIADGNWRYVVSKQLSGTGYQGYAFGKSNSGYAFIEIEGTNPNYIQVQGTKSIQDGKWHHILGTYNGSMASIYVDGILERNTSYVGGFGANTNNLYVGSPSYTTLSYFTGYIDEVRIYNRSLSAAEVADLYNLGSYHINWNNGGAWSNAQTVQDGIGINSATTGKFMQMRVNLNSNDTDVSPYVISYNVSGSDATNPNITILNPGNNSGLNNQNVGGINFSANVGDDMSGVKNATLNIYNQSGIYNQTSASFLNSKYGLNFDGTGYVDAGNDARLRPGNITLALWVKLNTYANDAYFISYGNTGANGYHLGTYNGGGTNRFAFMFAGHAFMHSTTVPNMSRWYHLAVTYNGSSIRMYVNGTFESSYTDTAYGTPSSNFMLGRKSSSAAGYENAVMDEIMVFNQSLNDSEIAALYNSGIGTYTDVNQIPFNTKLAAAWHLDEGSGLTAYDVFGRSNGTLNGGITWVTGKVTSPATTADTGLLQTTIGITVSLVNGIYNWFWNLFDYSGNQVTTSNYTYSVGNICTSGNLSTTCILNNTYYFSDGEIISGTGNLIINSSGSIANYSSRKSVIINFTTITILSGGNITGGNISIVTNNLTIYSGGKIYAANLGYAGLAGPGTGSSGTTGSGAGHGGTGGDSQLIVATSKIGGAIYGSSLKPNTFGSGGGLGNTGSNPGAGGGIINLIVSNTITINGTISSNGQTSPISNAGGGSGGSVYIDTNNFAGSGNITANGGNGYDGGGGGAGGRVALYYNQSSFSGINQTSVLAGNKGATVQSFIPGALAGSLILIDKINNLATIKDGFRFQGLTTIANETTAQNQTFWNSVNPNYYNFTNITIFNGAYITSQEQNIIFNISNSLNNNNGQNLYLSNFMISSYYNFTLLVKNTFNSLTTNNMSINFLGALNYFSLPWLTQNLELTNSTIYNTNLNLNLNNLSIDTSSRLSANFVGYAGLTGPGVGASGTTGSGAGHGNLGGDAQIVGGTRVGGAAYGSSLKPSTFGSGGGLGNTGSTGGAGGGIINLIISNAISINGTLSSNGQTAPFSNAAGGSAGSIYIDTNNFAGKGNITANGGDGYDGGGGGSGGRVAVYYNQSTFSGINQTSVIGGNKGVSIPTTVPGAQAGSLILMDKINNTATIKNGFRFQGLTTISNESVVPNQIFWNSANPYFYNFTSLTIINANLTKNFSADLEIGFGNILNFTNVTFNAFNSSLSYNTNYGKIFWNKTVNMSSIYVNASMISLTDKNATVVSEVVSALNKTATISFYNTGGMYLRQLRKDGALCTSPNCTVISSGNSFVFNVSGFTSYTLNDNIIPTISSALISSTNITRNDTYNNLTSIVDASDTYGDNVTLAYNWYKTNASGETLAATTLITQGLVAYYPFNNDTDDYYGNNTGTNNGATLNTSGGRIGGAYRTDLNKYINQNNPQNLPTGSSRRTICSWINPSDNGAGKRWVVGLGSTSYNQAYEFGLAGSSNNPYIGFWGPEYSFAGYQCSVGTWCQICMAYDGTYNLFYFNSQLIDNRSISFSTGSGYLTFGTQLGNSYAEYFNGSIDEVAVYNRTLSATEITQIYRAGVAGGDKLAIDNNLTGYNDTWKIGVRALDYLNISNEFNSTNTLRILDFRGGNITLTPDNNTFLNNYAPNLTANITSPLGLFNATLNVYNSSNELIYTNTTSFIEGTASATVGIVVTLVEGVYTWFYNAFDLAGNMFSGQNHTITIETEAPGINLISPSDNLNTSINSQNLTASLSDNFGLENATLLIYNSSGAEYSIVEFRNGSRGRLGQNNLVNGLIAYYPLDENFNDYSPNGNNLSVLGSTPALTAGLVGSAFSFNGTGMLDNEDMRPQLGQEDSYTESIWIKTEGIDAQQIFFGFHDSQENPYGAYMGVLFNNLDANGDLTDISFGTGGAWAYWDFLRTDLPNITQWHLITATYNGSTHTKKIYIDGSNPVESIDSNYGANIAATERIYVGGGKSWAASEDSLFYGQLDEAIIWNRTLSVEEILELYNNHHGLSLLESANFNEGALNTEIGEEITFEDGRYNWKYTTYDLAGNYNETANRTFTIDTHAPIISNIVYLPNTTFALDPAATIYFNATVSDALVGVNGVVLQMYNGSVWRNSTMTLANGNVYSANFTLDPFNANYTFNIFANDSVGNVNVSINTSFISNWDCEWNAYTDNAINTSMGVASGFGETKLVRNVFVRNNGDYNYSVDHCKLRISFSAGGSDERFSYNNSDLSKFYVDANSSIEIPVSYTYRSVNSQFDYTLALTAVYSPTLATHSNLSFAGSILTQQDGPYLVQEIGNMADIIDLNNNSVNFVAYVENVMGDDTVINTAYNISSIWNVPTSFVNKSGKLNNYYENLSNNSQIDESLELEYIDLENMKEGYYNFNLTTQGYENISASAENLTLINRTLNNSVLLYFRCSLISDNVPVWDCLDKDPDTVACGNGRINVISNETCDDGNTNSGDGCSAICRIEPQTITGGGSSSSGGGGGGSSTSSARVEKSEASFELVRGSQNEFTFEVKNKYDYDLTGVNITVSGINAEYIKISPSSFASIKAKEAKNITVKISAPAYFSGKKYTLIFEISGKMIDNSTQKKIDYTDRKAVTLTIVEIPRVQAENLLINATNYLEEMNKSGMVMKEAKALFASLNSSYNEIEFGKLKTAYAQLKLLHDNAFEAKALIEELVASLADAKTNGIKATESKKLLLLGQTIYERGDYALALERLKEAKLTYALEVKGEYNLAYAIKNHPLESLGILIGLGLVSLGSGLAIRFQLLRRKLRMLNEEEVLLLELMKVIQKECFEKNHMSMEEYESAMYQYENRLSETVQEKITVETKLANILKIKGKRVALGEEKSRLTFMLRKAQDDYLNKGKIETRIYENMIRSYTKRLSEVEEQIATMDADEAVRKSKKSFS